jgi:hypothetical protein
VKGYGHKVRSSFEAEDIILFYESLNGLEIGFEADGHWEYFIVDKPFFEKRKKYRMVFCIDRSSKLSEVTNELSKSRKNF